MGALRWQRHARANLLRRGRCAQTVPCAAIPLLCEAWCDRPPPAALGVVWQFGPRGFCLPTSGARSFVIAKSLHCSLPSRTQVTAVLDAMGGGSGQKAQGADGPERQTGTSHPPAPGDSASAEAVALEAASGGAGGPQFRTTHMFSATFPPEVQKMAKKYLRSPATVAIGDQDR